MLVIKQPWVTTGAGMTKLIELIDMDLEDDKTIQG